jgi:ASCH domain
MRVLSVRQPFADLIVSGCKPIENRSWRTPYRGPLLIHAASVMHDIPLREIERRYRVHVATHLPLGGIVGAAFLIDCVSDHNSRWFDGPFGFVLAGAIPCAFVALAGKQGFFNVPDTIWGKMCPKPGG